MALIDITGKTFNRWTVLKFDAFDQRGEAYWYCRCDCGSERSVTGYSLRKGTSKGCLKCREPYRLGTPYEEINGASQFTTQSGERFIVSPEDAKAVSKHGWCFAQKRGYMVASINGSTMLLHHFLLGNKKGMYVDHINGDKTDNRRENLRWATPSQSAWNLNLSSRNTSGYKGVHWNKTRKKWQAHIHQFGKMRTIGFFDTREEAALAYNEQAKEIFGEFACINPLGDTSGYRVIEGAGVKNGKRKDNSFGLRDVFEC